MASYRLVAGPASFSDDTEHAVTIDSAIAAGETLVAFIGCSVTTIEGIVGYVDSDNGFHSDTASPYLATQTSWKLDEEFGGASGGGYRGVSCFSSYCPDGMPSGATIRWGVKHGSGAPYDADGFYHGQSPFICVVALTPDSGKYFVYDTSDGNNENNTTTPNSPSIVSAADAIVLGFFAGATTVGVGWFTPGGGWTELVDSAQGTESLYNIACQARIAATSYSGDSSGTSSVSASFGMIISSYKQVSTEPNKGPTLLVGTKEPGDTTDFFSSGDTAAWPFLADNTGVSARMGARFNETNGGSLAGVKLGIYSNGSGQPGTLLGSGTVSIPPNKNVAFGAVVAGVNIVASTTYWLAVSGHGEQVDIKGATANGSTGKEGVGEMAGSWSAGGNMGNPMGIWVETAGADPLAKAGAGIIGP